MTSPVDTLKALRAEIDGTNYGDHDSEQDEQIAALDAAIAALSGGEARAWEVQFGDGSGFLAFTEEEAEDAIAEASSGGAKHPLYTTPRAVGDGMVVVPREPTEAMLDALRSQESYCDSCHGVSFNAETGYEKMLAAAPGEGSGL